MGVAMGRTRAKRVLVVGPGISEKGGISSVLRLHRQTAAWKEMHCRLLITYLDGSVSSKIRIAIKSYFLAPFLLRHSDLVHVHLAGQSSLLRKLPIALWARLLGKPMLVHVHAFSPESLFERTPVWAYRFVLGTASRVVALSERWAQAIHRHMPEARVVVIPNPVLEFPVGVKASAVSRQIVL